MWGQSRRLYVAEFSNGVVKIGITSAANPERRLRALSRVIGCQPIRYHVGERHACGFWGEQQLVGRLQRIANKHMGREWFTGVRFGAAKHLVEQMTRRAVALSLREQEAESVRVHAADSLACA